MTNLCAHCGKPIEFYKGHWWHGDDFMCPDGERAHTPKVNRQEQPMKLFAVTVMYIKTNGSDCSAVALVGAADAMEAIDTAAEGVRALPHCREVQGGMCEEVADLEPNAREPNAQRATHATHATVN